MCGIWGFVGVSKRIRTQSAQEGLQSLTDRGPDDWGVYASGRGKAISWNDVPDGEVSEFLGNRRLSILDLSSAGNQPMLANNSKLRLVYNGEVYNYRELREELREEGYEFKSDTDTEVVLRAYQEYGEECVDRFRGMFAFAIRDEERGTLFAARDRFGIKPFYYTASSDRIAFASELTALLAADIVEKKLDERAVNDFLALGSVAAPRTIVTDISALEPGHTLTYDTETGNYEVDQYWTPTFSDDENLSAERVRELLSESVSLRLRSDVPVGAFLSGGLDSSAIVALMRENNVSQLHTYSVGFEQSEYSETEFAESVADSLKTDHTSETVTAQDVKRELPDIVNSMDQPTIDGVNTYFVSELATSDDLRVALSGLGGDELFYGYPTFRQVPLLYRAASIATRAPRTFRRLVATGLDRLSDTFPEPPLRELADVFRSDYPFGSSYIAARGVFPSSLRQSLLDTDGGHDHLAAEIEETISALRDGAPLESAVSEAELRWYMQNQLLRDTDAMSMCHSLEVRVPFLDTELAEHIFATPSSEMRRGKGDKPLLRRAVAGCLPDSVLDREKTGFTFPFAEWLKDELTPVVDEALRSEAVEQTPLDLDEAEHVRKAFEAGELHWSRLWALVVLSLWIDEHLVE